MLRSFKTYFQVFCVCCVCGSVVFSHLGGTLLVQTKMKWFISNAKLLKAIASRIHFTILLFTIIKSITNWWFLSAQVYLQHSSCWKNVFVIFKLVCAPF
jgi:hypothetical protein